MDNPLYLYLLMSPVRNRSRPAESIDPDRLPAWFPGLTGVPAIVVFPAAASAATKSLSSAAGPVGLGLRLIDLQRASPQFGSVQRGDGFIGLAGVRHFNKCEAPRATGFPVGHDADLFDSAMRLENVAQLGLGCAVG